LIVSRMAPSRRRHGCCFAFRYIFFSFCINFPSCLASAKINNVKNIR
jgi:hypothetical protein